MRTVVAFYGQQVSKLQYFPIGFGLNSFGGDSNSSTGFVERKESTMRERDSKMFLYSIMKIPNSEVFLLRANGGRRQKNVWRRTDEKLEEKLILASREIARVRSPQLIVLHDSEKLPIMRIHFLYKIAVRGFRFLLCIQHPKSTIRKFAKR